MGAEPKTDALVLAQESLPEPKSGPTVEVVDVVLTSEAVKLFRSLLDEEYYKNLQIRLKSGICSAPVEALILKYAHGDPVAHHQAKQDVQRFRDLARAAAAFRKERPQEARELDRAFQTFQLKDEGPEDGE